jgi:Ca2+/Na+ antiporter
MLRFRLLSLLGGREHQNEEEATRNLPFLLLLTCVVYMRHVVILSILSGLGMLLTIFGGLGYFFFIWRNTRAALGWQRNWVSYVASCRI